MGRIQGVSQRSSHPDREQTVAHLQIAPKPRPTQPHNRTAAFTLIELLVVIAIIVVLLGVAIPTFRKARDVARRVVCTSHLRQLQTAWYVYAEDHDGYIVCGRSARWHESGGDTPWRIIGEPWLIADEGFNPANRREAETLMRTGALADYVGDVDVYRCPSQYDLSHLAEYLHDGWRWLSPYAIVSTMNCLTPSEKVLYASEFAKGRVRVNGQAYITKLSDLSPPGPARRMVFVDIGCPLFASDAWPSDWFIISTSPHIPKGWTSAGSGAPIHHGNGTCVSFADGSVRYWKWKDSRTVAWSRAMQDWFEAGAPGERPDYVPDPNNADYIEFCQATWGSF